MSDILRGQSRAKSSENAEKITVGMEAEPEAGGRQVAAFHASWQGPLPPPKVFNEYPKSVQEKIVNQMVSEAAHRRQIEKQNADLDARVRDGESGMAMRLIRDQFIGQCLGFVVVLAVIGAASYLIDSGKQPGWLFILLAALAGVVPLLRRGMGVFRKNGDDGGR